MPNYTTFSVLFFVRKHHNETKKLFIYARITVDGKRAEISLKRSISVNHWDTSKGRAKGTAPKSRILNQYLDQVYHKLLDCHKQLSSVNDIISAQPIKARFYGNDDNHKTLLELLDYHNSHMKNVLKQGTLKNYFTTETYLKEILKHKMSCNNINLKQINYRFITDFEQFLRNYSAKIPRKTCGNNGTMKHLERFKKMLNLSIKLEWLVKNLFDNFNFRFEKNERQYLSKRELQLLENTEFTSSSLQKVKDIFMP